VRAKCARARTQDAVGKNPRAQAAPSFEKLFRPGRERLIHPIARPAFFRPAKANALHLKFISDQRVQISTARDHIPADGRCGLIVNIQGVAQLRVDFLGKKADLSLIRIAVIEKPIAADAMTGHTFDAAHLEDWIFIRGFAVMSEVVVRRRGVEMHDFHAKPYHAARPVRMHELCGGSSESIFVMSSKGACRAVALWEGRETSLTAKSR
jgi:hypothetical protein